ncbi:MAG: LysE family translocator [Pseudomonadota bacterium]|nr:LysE family translocator [Pseudomonadota bacterium]
MHTEALLALAAFAFTASITPGPNNTLLLASGANFGLARTVPAMLGVNVGFGFMIFAVGLGAGTLFTTLPWIQPALRVAGVAFLLWMAWRIATAAPMERRDGAGRPLSFLAMAAFQWLNPKAWIMVGGAMTSFLPPDGGVAAVLAITAVFGVVNLPCILSWAAFGSAFRRLLADPRHARIFNRVMAVLLCLSLVPIVQAILADAGL